MKCFVLFCYLTTPFVFGVGFTLTSPELNRRANAPLVYVAAVVWIVAAYRVQIALRNRNVKMWRRWWFLLVVALPLIGCFLSSLSHDPEVTSAFERISATNNRSHSEYRAAAAPGSSMFTASQCRELVACVQPRLARFVVQLALGLPPLWWLFAFGFSLWKGK